MLEWFGIMTDIQATDVGRLILRVLVFATLSVILWIIRGLSEKFVDTYD